MVIFCVPCNAGMALVPGQESVVCAMCGQTVYRRAEQVPATAAVHDYSTIRAAMSPPWWWG